MDDKALREHLEKALTGHEAHTDWRKALADLPPAQRAAKPPGAPHSAWELLEHVRIAQWDIFEFCRNPKHESPDWPSGYWPERPSPPNEAAWEKSVKQFLQDTKAMEALVADSEDRSIRADSAWIGADRPARSAVGGRPQFLPPGAVRPAAAIAGFLAGNLAYIFRLE